MCHLQVFHRVPSEFVFFLCVLLLYDLIHSHDFHYHLYYDNSQMYIPRHVLPAVSWISLLACFSGNLSSARTSSVTETCLSSKILYVHNWSYHASKCLRRKLDKNYSLCSLSHLINQVLLIL